MAILPKKIKVFGDVDANYFIRWNGLRLLIIMVKYESLFIHGYCGK